MSKPTKKNTNNLSTSKNPQTQSNFKKGNREPKQILKTLYDDPITAKITQLSFFSKTVRKETKKLRKFCEDMQHTAKFHKLQKAKKKDKSKKNKIKNVIKSKKKLVDWVNLTNEQKIIIQEKGVGEDHWHRLIQGPYAEKFSKDMDCAHMGIYKNGIREEWGKMVTKGGIYIESGFRKDKPCGKVLIIKPNGTYFEGNIDSLKKGKGSDKKESGKNEGKIKGIFRNPVLKR